MLKQLTTWLKLQPITTDCWRRQFSAKNWWHPLPNNDRITLAQIKFLFLIRTSRSNTVFCFFTNSWHPAFCETQSQLFRFSRKCPQVFRSFSVSLTVLFPFLNFPNFSYIGICGPGHFHTDCTLWGRLVFGKIQERLGLELGLVLENTKCSKFPLAMFCILRFIGCA